MNCPDCKHEKGNCSCLCCCSISKIGTPSGPAKMMGVINAPTLASTLASSSAIDLFQFKNGIAGSGPLGFQPGIA
ncbi:MAG: hypothetical protein M8315_05460, partial [Nitrosopumilus sp.]|nr:hypothetical protein [Nitrosopumilus sp.]